MIFTVVDEMKKKDPKANIIVVVNQEVPLEIRKDYNFEFLYLPMKNKLEIAAREFFLISKLMRGKADRGITNEFIKILSNTKAIIDISGFALSSKFSRNNTINFIAQISIAKNSALPIYLFPQSFGPFNYRKLERPFVNYLIKKYMSYPKAIFVREKDGLDQLEVFDLPKLYKSVDTVFHHRGDYNINNIFSDNNKIRKNFIIKENAVGIVPNIKTIGSKNYEDLHKLYEKIIDHLSKSEMNVYLLKHSVEDLELLESLYAKFEKDENVSLLSEEYNSIELQHIIKKFNFIIASRYHSIVHAYKVGTPAIVLGWAVKYKELLDMFDQSEYQFDVDNVNHEKFMRKIHKMNNNYIEERNKIKEVEKNILTHNIFDLMEDEIFEK